MKILKKAFLTVFSIILLTGCENNQEASLPLIALEQTESCTEVTATVKKLYDTTAVKSNGGSGMMYNPNSGSWQYGIVMGGKSSDYTKYYALLADKSNTTLRFEMDGEDWELLSEGDEITITVVSYDPPSLSQSTRFFWGDYEIYYEGNVTENINDVAEDTPNNAEEK